MRARQLNPRFTAIALAVALLFIVNPEVRVFLFFVDAFGIELLVFLLAIQLRFFLASAQAFAGPMHDTLCNGVDSLVTFVIRLAAACFAFRLPTILVSPLLLIVPASYQCHMRRFEPQPG
jgi:hypothetical protein